MGGRVEDGDGFLDDVMDLEVASSARMRTRASSFRQIPIDSLSFSVQLLERFNPRAMSIIDFR